MIKTSPRNLGERKRRARFDGKNTDASNDPAAHAAFHVVGGVGRAVGGDPCFLYKDERDSETPSLVLIDAIETDLSPLVSLCCPRGFSFESILLERAGGFRVVIVIVRDLADPRWQARF